MTTTASHPPRQRHTKYAAMTVSFELVYSHALHARRMADAPHAHVSSRVLSARVGLDVHDLIQSHREPRGRGESQTRNRRVLLLAGWCSFCELDGCGLRPLPLIANWHIPLQNFPQVDLWGLVLLCVTFLSSGVT